MSEAPDKDQKTHEPTEKRLQDARKRGEVASAPEMRHAAMLAAGVIVVGWAGSGALAQIRTLFASLWGSAEDFTIDPQAADELAVTLFAEIAFALGPMLGLLCGFALLTAVLQGRPTLAWKRVAPKWSKLNPLSGFGRLLGPRALIEFGKTLLKFTAVTLVATYVIWPQVVGLDQLIGAGPEAIGAAATALVLTMVKAVALLVAAIAGFDFVYQRRAFLSKMRMTLQEVKDEHKQSDGDPMIKAKIRQIGAQRSRKRMMAAVPGASVIVTNPTHYSVALKYEHGGMSAPVVVAKGVDAVAMRIREIATEHQVPIVESPPLARALYASVEIDRPIPAEHYKAVAEIIGYVMRLARERRAA